MKLSETLEKADEPKGDEEPVEKRLMTSLIMQESDGLRPFGENLGDLL